MKKLHPYAKAVVAALTAAAASLTLVITGGEGIGDVTTAEWLIVVTAVLASGGFVYAVPNKP